MKNRKSSKEHLEEGVKSEPLLEQKWLKKARHKPEIYSSERNRWYVGSDMKRRDELLKEGYNTMIHTHPSFIDVVNNRAIKDIFVGLPSIQDLDVFIKGPYKNTIIAQIDERANIEGYVVLRKKKSFDLGDHRITEDLERYDKTKHAEQLNQLRKFSDKYGIKYRFVPMAGYEFDEQSVMFKKKSDYESHGLERKIATVGIFLLGLSLLLQINKFTGFVINISQVANFSSISNNLSVILAIISFILFLFLEIRRK